MSPFTTIYALVVALYLLECFAFARSDTIVFAPRVRTGEWRVLQGFALSGLSGRLYFGPLLPFRPIFSARWPESAVAASLDLQEAQFRYQALRMRSRTLAFLCTAMTIHVLAFTPIIFRLFGWRASWIVAIVILVALSIAIAVDMSDITREFARPNAATFALLAPACLSPLAASRAFSTVSRLCFKASHPLVVYRVVMPIDRCHDFASELLAADNEELPLEATEALFLRTEFIVEGHAPR